MARIICIHSFRGGTGKSNLTANLAACLAGHGRRVGVIDTDVQSPGIHILFHLDEDAIQASLNDFLRERCKVEEAAYDVSSVLGESASGTIHLIPSSLKAREIAQILREGYDVSRLSDGYRALIDHLGLDLLLIDTHPGLNEETLLSIAVSDLLLQILRPDQQDFQGTAVALEVARKLNVPSIEILVNKVPSSLSHDELAKKVESTYDVPVAAVLPLSEDLVRLGSAGLFCLEQPEHPWAVGLRGLADRLA